MSGSWKKLPKEIRETFGLILILVFSAVCFFVIGWIIKWTPDFQLEPGIIYIIILTAIIYFSPTIKEFVRKLSLKVAKMTITILGVEMEMTVPELVDFIEGDNLPETNLKQRKFLNKLSQTTVLQKTEKDVVKDPNKNKDKLTSKFQSGECGLISINTNQESDDNVVVRFRDEQNKSLEELLKLSYMPDLRALRNASLIRTEPENVSLKRCDYIKITKLGKKFVTEMNKKYSQ